MTVSSRSVPPKVKHKRNKVLQVEKHVVSSFGGYRGVSTTGGVTAHLKECDDVMNSSLPANRVESVRTQVLAGLAEATNEDNFKSEIAHYYSCAGADELPERCSVCDAWLQK